MSVDHIRYDLLSQDALRGVIRTVLTDAAVKGLPGDHHFFITFDTRADGVRISARLKASYPTDMTIVLQHQFWDLAVGEEDFEVGLAFNGIPERLHIPLKAVKAFFDPSVRFGLQFTVEADAVDEEATAAADPQTPADAASALATKKLKPELKQELKKTAKPRASMDSAKAPVKPVPAATKDEAAPTGEVVRFDRFRKK